MRLYRSSDGLHWEQASTAGADLGNLASDGTSLYAADWSKPQVAFMRSTDAGRTWSELDRGSQSVSTIIGGPAGLDAIGELRDEGIPDEPGLQASIEKDGYILQVLGDGGVHVIDAEIGAIMLAFGPAELEADEPPETIIEEQVDDWFTVTFLDPDTLEPLVTITEQDLSEALGEPGGASAPEFLIGWSADGEHWGWQTATEAFGTNGLIQLAVGDGAVVATFEELTDTPNEPPTVRIFAAHPT